MINHPIQTPLVINDHALLMENIQDWVGHSKIAVDTESNGLHAYREQVCLIQISTIDEDYLIDPLAFQDLSPLGSVFADPNIEKIFHAAEYDVSCLNRDFGFTFENIFDTMVAARTLGWNALGLGDILMDQFGVQVNKKFQRADWGKRPLPENMLMYAQNDTHYLSQLRDVLKDRLMACGRWDLAQEDFARLTQIWHETQEFDENLFWNIKGARDLTPRQAAVLHEVFLFREKMARKIKKPPFKVLGNLCILSIAEKSPHTIEELQSLPGMSLGKTRQYGYALLKRVVRGEKAEPLRPSHSKKLPRSILRRLARLRSWRYAEAKKMQVDSNVILPKDLMMDIVNQQPSDMEELSRILKEAPVRFERFGKQILESIRRSED